MSNGFRLEDIYFTVLPRGAPNGSTLYRFNLTYGELEDIGDKFTPENDVFAPSPSLYFEPWRHCDVTPRPSILRQVASSPRRGRGELLENRGPWCDR
ncbi:hypothetical protein HPB50_029056 [Hyalomma asiaticum]|nr:hypothetical protein HPB50_029056 [Hyalomma asiaticum]